MRRADDAPIAAESEYWEIAAMSAAESGKNSKRETEKPSLSCAICNRRYRPIQTPGMHTIYSICPDCRLTIAIPPAQELD